MPHPPGLTNTILATAPDRGATLSENKSRHPQDRRVISNHATRRAPHLLLTTKLTLAAVLSSIACVATTLAITVSTLNSEATVAEHAKLEANLRLAWRLVGGTGGAIDTVNGKLRAGGVVLDGNLALVDEVQGLVGGVMTIFHNTTRVATTVKLPNGRRANGTGLAPGPAYDAVARRHVRYDGIATIIGRPYITIYDPIFSPRGEFIGILFVGEQLADFQASVEDTRNRILLGGAAAVMLIGVGFSLLSRRMLRPLRALIAAILALARDEVVVSVPGLERGDEIGAVARAVMDFRGNRAELAARELELRRTHMRFEAALSNMSQGLCMFDASGRLEVVNQQFCKLYDIDCTQPKPGITFPDMLAMSSAIRNAPGIAFDDYVAQRVAFIARREAATMQVTLAGERAISIKHRPLPSGGWVATYEDVTERNAADAKIVHLAQHDILTSLPNRTSLYQRMDHVLTEAGRGMGAAILYLDLDHFKPVNDTLGHTVGDGLLCAVAERLLACTREVDMVARLGGDEFAIIQQGIERPEDVQVLAARIIRAIAVPFEIDGHQIAIGASIGIALVGQDGTDTENLLKRADLALYRAKDESRGTSRFFEQDMDDRAQQRRKLEIDLRHGLANDEFQLFYQPLIDIQTAEVSGFEALLRWQHPQRGMVPPGEFIPMAEDTGLIVPLGEWVIRQACAEAAMWPGGIKVAVNLSALQFRSDNLVPTIAQALAQSGLAPGRLELEVTETLLLQDSDTTVATLHAMRALGARIAMDDFGTGYSSLSYLRSFPFDKIKIDQSFIRDLSQHEDSVHIVRAIKGLASGLGMTTTAEGVETEEQFARLQLEGCTEVQGYLFSKPRPACEVLSILDKVRARRPWAGERVEPAALMAAIGD